MNIYYCCLDGEKKGQKVDPRMGKDWSLELGEGEKLLTHQCLLAPKHSDKNLPLQNLIPLIRKNLNVI